MRRETSPGKVSERFPGPSRGHAGRFALHIARLRAVA
jgi:hypothetical protein